MVRLEKSIYDELLGEKSIAGTTLRRMLISSLIQQLSAGNSKIRSVLAGEEEKPRKKSESAQHPRSPKSRSRMFPEIDAASEPPPRRSPVESAADPDDSAQELLRIAGVMEDWQVDMRGVGNMQLVTDEAARRRQYGRRRY